MPQKPDMPLAPFQRWLGHKTDQMGTRAVADMIGVDEARIRRVQRGDYDSRGRAYKMEYVTLDLVDRWVTALGDHYLELYPEMIDVDVVPSLRVVERRGRTANRTCECGKTKFKYADRCQHCEDKTRRDRRQERRHEIADAWHMGLTLKEIAVRLDSTANALSVEMAGMRKDGWDLPKRGNNRLGLSGQRAA